MKVHKVFSEFESLFGRLAARDQAILAPDKVVMFLHVVGVWGRHDLGTLLEDVSTESGLTDEWDHVRNRVARFIKRKQWLGDEEKRVFEPTSGSRVVPKDH